MLTTPALLRLGSAYVLRTVVQRIERHTGHHLALHDIALAWAGEYLELRITSPRLSQPGQMADDSFAAAREVRLYARWRTLLAGAWRLDGVAIDGLRLKLRRTADGRIDFAGPWGGPSGGRALSLGALALTEAHLDWYDEGQPKQLVISELYAGPLYLLPNGRISLAGISGQGKVRSAAQPTQLTWHLALADLHATPTSMSVERLKLTLQSQPDAVLAELTFENAATDRVISSIGALGLAGHYRIQKRLLHGALSARLQGSGAQWRLDALSGRLALDDPRLPDALPIAGQLSLNTATQHLQGELRSHYLGAAVSGRFEARRQPPQLRFTFEIEHFDLDRWRSVEDVSGRSTARIPGWMADLALDGRLEVGRLRVAGSEAERVRLHLHGRPGRWAWYQQRGGK